MLKEGKRTVSGQSYLEHSKINSEDVEFESNFYRDIN